MLYQQQSSEVASKLLTLNSKDLLSLINQNDQMILTWNQSQLFRKWPPCLVPIPAKSTSNNILFTGMLQNTKQKAYQYHNIIEPIDYVFEKRQKMGEELSKEQEFTVREQEGDNQLAKQHIGQNEQQLQEQDRQKQQSQQQLKISNFKKSGQSFSPFLANYDNPFDRNANSKALKHKFDRLKLDNKKRNIAALVQQSKQGNEQKSGFKYGKSAPKKATQSIDITDILKYTLGIKKQRENNVQPPPIRNPFVRTPQKYETAGNFYGGFSK